MEHYLKKELYELVKTDGKIFDFIQTSSLDGMWYWDLENPENEWMSEKFWTELGYNPDEMPHKASAWQGIINQEDSKLAIEKINNYLSDPSQPPYDQIIRYIHKNGSTVYIRCRGLVIRDNTGKPKRMLGAHNNITSAINYRIEKEISEKLSSLNKLLISKNEELKQFNYITSHDLQEPLNTIISFSNLLEMEKDKMEEIGQKSIEIIKTSANRMKDFIISLLEYSRIGREKEKTKVDIIQLVENLKIDLSDLINRTQARINYVGEPLKIMAYEHDLVKVFENLVVNGIKYTNKKKMPLIIINSEEQTDNYKFSISDNGIGIPKEQFEKIFEVFQRLHSRDKYTGTGIGLSYCKKVIELHDGRIWLDSEEGKGTTFYFTVSKKI